MTDKDVFLKLLLTHPHRTGMLVGGALLAIIHTLLAIIIQPGNPHIYGTGDSMIFLRALSGFIWGSVIGSSAARATAAWMNGQREEARGLCKSTGLTQGIIHFSWFALCTYSYTRTTPLSWHLILPTVGWFWISNACLQAALTLFAIGVLLPRTPERTVQITENLRL